LGRTYFYEWITLILNFGTYTLGKPIEVIVTPLKSTTNNVALTRRKVRRCEY
jgi:hypothetical protein